MIKTGFWQPRFFVRFLCRKIFLKVLTRSKIRTIIYSVRREYY